MSCEIQPLGLCVYALCRATTRTDYRIEIAQYQGCVCAPPRTPHAPYGGRAWERAPTGTGMKPCSNALSVV
jgi:hypothetical protein